MGTTLPTSEAVSFGVFSVNLRTHELQKHGVRLKISPQAFRVLVCLLTQPGELVLREDLCRLLWPGDTHVEFEANLNAIIRDLRQILNDSARSPRFIQTELKRGYRFIAPVRETAPAPERPLPESPAPIRPEPVRLVTEKPTRRKTLTLGAALLLCLALVSTLVLWWLWKKPHAAGRPARLTQLTSFVGRAGHPSFSPDGSKVAFHWDGAAHSGFDIYVRTIGSEQFARLTHDPSDDLFPAWSPDGRDIAFLRRFEDGHCAIYLVPAGGGTERMVAAVPTESTLSWSADGRWIAYAKAYSADPSASSPDFGVYAVSLLSGQVKRLSSAGRDWLGDQDPAFSPDGRWVAYFRTFSMGVSELFAQQIDSAMQAQGNPRQITFEKQNSRATLWMPDSRSIIFSSLRGGVRSLWRVPITPGSGEPRAVGGEEALEATIDGGGTRIVYERTAITDALRLMALCAPGKACAGGQPRPLAYPRQLARNPTWSPDGRKIAFESYTGARIEVWICNSDGSNAVQLSSFASTITGTPRWAPDSRHLALDSRVDGRSKIFLVDAETRQANQLTTGASEDTTPTISHDGKTVYFVSNRGGDFQLWRTPISGGAARQITKQGAFYPVESPDGKTLYYAKGMQRTTIGQVPVDGGEERVVIDSLGFWQNFTVGSSGIYFVPTTAPRDVPVYFYDFSNGKQSKIGTVNGIIAQGLSLSSDGRSLLLCIRESVETNLMSLESPSLNSESQ